MACFPDANAWGQFVRFNCSNTTHVATPSPNLRLDHSSVQTTNYDFDGDGSPEGLYQGHSIGGGELSAIVSSTGRSYVFSTGGSDHDSFQWLGVLHGRVQTFVLGESLEDYGNTRTSIVQFISLTGRQATTIASLSWECTQSQCYGLKPVFLPLEDGRVVFLLGNTVRFLMLEQGSCSLSPSVTTPMRWTDNFLVTHAASTSPCMIRTRFQTHLRSLAQINSIGTTLPAGTPLLIESPTNLQRGRARLYFVRIGEDLRTSGYIFLERRDISPACSIET